MALIIVRPERTTSDHFNGAASNASLLNLPLFLAHACVKLQQHIQARSLARTTSTFLFAATASDIFDPGAPLASRYHRLSDLHVFEMSALSLCLSCFVCKALISCFFTFVCSIFACSSFAAQSDLVFKCGHFIFLS